MIKELVAKLESLEAEGATQSLLVDALSRVQQPSELWEVADGVPALLPLMRAIYRRARQLDASEERARGYLAMAHYFDGDFETATALATLHLAEITDPVLFSVWALLPESSGERLERLRIAAKKCPDPRIFRSLADLANHLGAKSEAREALRWLIDHTHDIDELRHLNATYEALG